MVMNVGVSQFPEISSYLSNARKRRLPGPNGFWRGRERANFLQTFISRGADGIALMKSSCKRLEAQISGMARQL